jgi:hypothetical protein
VSGKVKSVNSLSGLDPMIDPEIPKTPLRVSVSGIGWMPDVALHRRGGKYLLEPSYASLVLSSFLLALAVALCFIPWHDTTLNGAGPPMKYLLAFILSWMAACGCGFFFVRQRLSRRLVIDPVSRTVTLRRHQAEAVLHWLIGQVDVADRARHGVRVLEWERMTRPQTLFVLNYSDIIGIQICNAPPDAYQANLVFRTATGTIERDCLTSHSAKRFCTALADQYSNEFGFKILDHIKVTPARRRPLETRRRVL